MQPHETTAAEPHELLTVFARQGFVFNATLHEMLNEHFTHHTERRGCGFTQATRHLAVLVNLPPEQRRDAITRLFPAMARVVTREGLPPALREAVRRVPESLAREESRVFAALVCDLVAPPELEASLPQLAPCFDALKMGTCPLAEKYFLEIADGHVRHGGRANVFVADDGRPLLLEKRKLGDDHSCINVQPVVLNGVRLPPGCLIGVKRADELPARRNRALPGEVIAVSSCEGFRLLRLTTLAISPEHRQRAFTVHFKAQLDAGLYAPGKTTIAQLRRVAEEQL